MEETSPSDFSWATLQKHCTTRLGYGYMTGLVAGSIMYFGQGLLIAPKGQRLATAISHMRLRGPLFGGTLAMWSGGFAFSSSLMKYYREKEDEWNDTIGGAFTGFIITIRSGGFSFALNQAI
jgi:Tim17/Tim22/Tim23/Pmp24 family